METIVAPITAPGQAAVSVVRISGEKTANILEKLVPKRYKEIIKNPGEMIFASILDLQDASVLDRGLVVFFKSPKSFTGENVAEFHLHGSPYLVSRLIENIISLGARLARPGEFSERAYLNGQVDLAQAEAIADLIASETSSQAKLAGEQLAGKLSEAILNLGEPLRNVLAEIEAYIDFPDEDIEPKTYSHWEEVLETVISSLTIYIDSFSSGKIYKEGAKIVLAGLPNAGKSSLLNLLLGESRAIVTEIAGTTRDSIEEKCVLNGLLLRLTDTAGLAVDYTPGKVESLGIERSWKEIEAADLVLYLRDLSVDDKSGLLEEIEKRAKKVLVVGNKLDLVGAGFIPARCNDEPINISITTNHGISTLKQKVYDSLITTSSSPVLITTERHKIALTRAREALTRGLEEIKKKSSGEFVALEVRGALGAISDIVGVTETEEILGRVFSKFCIGK